MVYIPPDQLWMVIVGFLIAFILAFGIGANDVANSFGTSVGAKVLTLRQACILASLFETLGSVFLGAKVSDTIRKGIIDVEPYTNDTQLLMVGNVAALSGTCCWLMAATLLRLPVSATHSIVGATVGFALIAHGVRGINWTKFAFIIGSWFASPVLAGIVSTLIFFTIKKFILNKEEPLENGLKALPIFYASIIVINFFSVFYEGPELFGFDKIPLYGTFILSFGSGIICAIIVIAFVVPWQRRSIKEKCKQSYEAAEHGKANSTQIKYSFPTAEINSSKSNTDVQNNSNNVTDRFSLQTFEKVNTIPSTELSSNCCASSRNTHTPHSTCMPGAVQDKILHDIMKPDTKKPVKSKIDKAEDAPLMDNEYKLGSITPLKSPTIENVSKAGLDETPNVEIQTTDCASNIDNAATNVKTSIDNLSDCDATLSCDAKKLADLENGGDTDSESDGGRSSIRDTPETTHLFSFLQILTAVFGAFAHGGNDVSNAIGPLVSLWLTATTGMVAAKAATPIWILFYGGVGISIGLWIWGRRVIKTLGEDLTKITPSSGFCIEIGSALTVLVASNIGIPISTTHCKVGSVVAVGRFRARENVDWTIFRNIVLAWLVTLPISGGISAAIMAGLRLTI